MPTTLRHLTRAQVETILARFMADEPQTVIARSMHLPYHRVAKAICDHGRCPVGKRKHGANEPRPDPTPAEIARQCEILQQQWSACDRSRRAGTNRAKPVGELEEVAVMVGHVTERRE